MRSVAILVLIAAASAMPLSACGRQSTAEKSAPTLAAAEPAYEPSASDVALSQPPKPVFAPTPEMNARRGRILFIANGCVICHQVNGVGGLAAPDLSAAVAPDLVDPLEFSARMWRGATAMAALQTIKLGYVIDLSAQNIADLAAFAASPEEQQLLTTQSVSDEMRGWFIDDQYWRSGDWDLYMKRGDKIPAPPMQEQ